MGGDDGHHDDPTNRQQQQQQQSHPSTRSSSPSLSSSSSGTRSMQHSTSFIGTVKQSVEDAVEDIRSRIGELPAGIVTRSHWPWETIHKNKSLHNNTNTQKKDKRDLPDSPMKLTPDQKIRADSNKNPELCIGSIFGLDVGGTLAKLVYFEQRPDQDMEQQQYPGSTTTSAGGRERLYHRAAAAQAVLKARRGHDSSSPPANKHQRSASMVEHRPLRERSFSAGLLKRKLSTANPSGLTTSNDTQKNNTNTNSSNNNHVGGSGVAMEMDSKQHRRPSVHSAASNDDLENLYRLRQESVPDDLDAFATALHYNPPTSHTDKHKDNSDTILRDQQNIHFQDEESSAGAPPNHTAEEESQPSSSASPGGTGGGMKKSRSMFDMSIAQQSRDHAEALNRFYHFARKLDTYREGVKDHKLSFYSRVLGGEFHFIRFETRRMANAMELIRANDLHLTIREMGATGGGAHKYASEWDRILGIQIIQQEELDSLLAGMQFVLSTVVGECYTFRPRKNRSPTDNDDNGDKSRAGEDVGIERKASVDSDATPVASSSGPPTEPEKQDPGPVPSNAFSSEESDSEEGNDSDGSDSASGTDEWWWSRKVQRDAISYSSAYPYLLVTIGTGVSILRVDGPRKHERISGSTIGGGTYWGLIRLLTDLEDFEDVMRLAEHGDPSKVDMMVGDIYGNNKEALEKLGLPASLVASSFGKLVAREDPAAGLKQEDLARALLLMVTNNIGQVAYLNAQLHKTNRIYFVGNFLRGNKLSQRRLSFAINYWSKGEMEALFLEHEGYFGALGAFLLSQDISTEDLEPPKRRHTEKKKSRDSESNSFRAHRRSQTLEDLF